VLKKILIGSFLSCVLAGACSAQNETLLIGPGDMLQVDVLDTPELSQQMRVTDSGNIPLAYLGTIHVAGETPGSAAAYIQDALLHKGIMRHPQVVVRVQEYATQDVAVIGQVHTPGSYVITTPQSILKVLSLAGGVLDTADRHIVVKRRGTEERINYYLANDATQALESVAIVNPGDTVLVSRAPVVYVLGDVNRPGGYAIATNDSHLTLLQAVAMAGSANKTSMQSRVRLIRKTSGGATEIPVRLDAIEKGKRDDIELHAGDIVYVPFSWVKNLAVNSSSIAASTAGAAMYAIH
jgi:polysaccharide biosynthesis/export protein